MKFSMKMVLSLIDIVTIYHTMYDSAVSENVFIVSGLVSEGINTRANS